MSTKLKNPWLEWKGPRVRRHRPQYSILVTALILVMIGAVIQFTISPAQVAQQTVQLGSEPWGGQNSYFYRHLLAIIVGVGALVAGFKIHIRHWLQWGPWILGISLVLAMITGLSGSRWLGLGPSWSIQPVEMVKVGVILVLAGFVLSAANHRSRSLWQTISANRWSLSLLALVSFVIGWLQSDLGSLVVIIAASLVMLIVSGIGWRLIGALGGIGPGGPGFLDLGSPVSPATGPHIPGAVRRGLHSPGLSCLPGLNRDRFRRPVGAGAGPVGPGLWLFAGNGQRLDLCHLCRDCRFSQVPSCWWGCLSTCSGRFIAKY